MEIAFENRYFCTKDLTKEYVKKITAPIRDFGLFMSAVALLFAIDLGKGGDYGFFYFFIACFAIIALTSLLLAPATVHSMIAAGNRLHNGTNPESVFSFSDEGITLTEGKVTMEFNYTQVLRIKETDNLYIMMISRNQGLMLKKDAFTIGTYPDFRSYALLKCPKLSK